MRKSILAALLALLAGGCVEKAPTKAYEPEDSAVEELQRENELLRNEQEDLLATLNEIEDGFREISEAQGRLTVDRRGEGEDARERIRENMRYIRETMAQNSELIEKLRSRLNESGRKSEQLRHTIENLMAQMEEKTAQIEQLRSELEAKNIRIDELDEQVATLSQDLEQLQQQTQQQDETISQQDRQINAAWYAVGTKHELKDHMILKGSKVLQGDFDASYFTEIDVRRVNQISLNSKDVKILTTHPAGSFVLERDENKVYTLRIIDAQQFWNTSKYLVVQVK